MTTIEEYNEAIASRSARIDELVADRTALINERDELYIPKWMRDALDDKNVTIKKVIERYDGLYQLNCSATYGAFGVIVRQTSLCRTIDDYNHFIRMIKEVSCALRT